MAGFSITFEENGGTPVTDLTEQTALPDLLPTPTKANNVFAGWYLDSSFTQKAVAGATIESNVTLYAKWYTPASWCKDIADAIREKEDSEEPIKHVDFAERITALPSPKEEETRTLTPDFSSGNHVIVPTTGKVLRQVTLTKPAQLIPENIKKDKNVCGVVGTAETGGVPLEQFVEFNAPYHRDFPGYRLLIFLARTPSWHTPVDIRIYYKNSSNEEVLLVSKRVDCGVIDFIVIPRSYGNLKIVMSLVPDAYYAWSGFYGFYARTNTDEVTQLTAPDWEDDFVLSYVDFDVFHVVFTAHGD